MVPTHVEFCTVYHGARPGVDILPTKQKEVRYKFEMGRLAKEMLPQIVLKEKYVNKTHV